MTYAEQKSLNVPVLNYDPKKIIRFQDICKYNIISNVNQNTFNNIRNIK